MNLYDGIKKLENLNKRASGLKPKLKIEPISILMSMRQSFGIGPSRIRDFDRHVENNEGDKCQVAIFDTIEEIEAFILSREML